MRIAAPEGLHPDPRFLGTEIGAGAARLLDATREDAKKSLPVRRLRQELAMETLGMSLAEGKAVLKGVQEFPFPARLTVTLIPAWIRHWLDWFHITMRITVLQQQVKTLKCEQPEVGEEVGSLVMVGLDGRMGQTLFWRI